MQPFVLCAKWALAHVWSSPTFVAAYLGASRLVAGDRLRFFPDRDALRMPRCLSLGGTGPQWRPGPGTTPRPLRQFAVQRHGEQPKTLHAVHLTSFLLQSCKASSSVGRWTCVAVFCCLDGGWAPRVPEKSGIRPCRSPATVPSYPTEAVELVGETLTLIPSSHPNPTCLLRACVFGPSCVSMVGCAA